MTRACFFAGALSFAAACAATTSSQDGTEGRARGAVYKPGQSIAEARLCTCRECLERSCCAGDGDAAEHVEPELGMTLAACGRCVRRVWTVRGAASCEASAGPECCPGTASE